MKRLAITTLVIGIVAACAAGALHATKSITALETAVGALVANYASATKVVSDKLQYVLLLVVALGVAWLSLTIVPRWRSRLLVALLFVELLALSWVCSLYRIFFQPVASIVALILAFVSAEAWSAFLKRNRFFQIRTFFADRLSRKQFQHVKSDINAFDPAPQTYDVTAVVCDVANKIGFAHDSQPGVFAERTARFIREAAEYLVKEGAYLQAADGEGVVALFGFPVPDGEHAQTAIRVVLEMQRNFQQRRQDSVEDVANGDMCAGVSAGVIVAGALNHNERPLLLTSGQPIELARRFCALNHFYGSNVLIDTLTFDRVSDAVIARPIDFVSGLNSHDRLEIYEPLCLSQQANPEQIARRDSFWNGVVLYREKRWAEAYKEFQKARDSKSEDDLPLQFYLRRLEPLLLQLANSPLE
jgi:class 3 adenylate cyclase